jgi:hypothetical protein
MLENSTKLSDDDIDVGEDQNRGHEVASHKVVRERLLGTKAALLGLGMASAAMTNVYDVSVASVPTFASYSALALPIRDDRSIIYDAIQTLFLSQNSLRDRRIAERLTALYRDALAEDEQMQGPPALQFADFMRSHKSLGFPMITLSQVGNVRARWIASERDYFAIEFRGGNQVKLIMGIPSANGGLSLLAGLVDIDAVIETVRTNGITAA